MTTRNRLMPRLIFVLLLLTGLFALRAWEGRGGFGPLDSGSRAPDYAAPSLTGDTVRLSELRGRVVLLNVWATWCKPCVREMPALQRLYEALEPAGLSVVAVSVDNAALGLGSAADDVRAFVAEYGIGFTILLDPESAIENVFQVTGLPMTYVIRRDGRIHSKVLGPREWDDPGTQAEIRQLLES
jgi:peroxiredoxin